MNAFNRVFVIVTLVMLLVLGVATLLSPALMLGLAQSTANAIRTGFFANYTDVGRFLARFMLAIGWGLLIGALLWRELRRPGSRTIEVAKYTGGSTIRISTAAVAERVKEEVDAIEGVIDAKVIATGRNKAVELSLDVSAAKGTDLVAKAEEIAQAARHVAQDELGLKLTGKPQVAIEAKQGKASKPKPPKASLPSSEPSEPLLPELPSPSDLTRPDSQQPA
jgi:preprotein translocase subunit SecG